MTRRPLLGITACNRQVGVETAAAVMRRYIDAAARYADAVITLVPSIPEHQSAAEASRALDGLLLTGTPSNIAPARYGADDPGDGPFDVERDAMALGLIEAVATRGRPVFGICRGFQEINVAMGGTLTREVGRGARGLAHHAPDDVDFASMFAHRHPVALAPGGALATATGALALEVNSVHYQGVDRLGAGLSVEATAPDGLIEAFAAKTQGADVFAVQWHPEWKPELDPASQTFFQMLGRALRGDSPIPDHIGKSA
jgi:putative glutamine amidotransferase